MDNKNKPIIAISLGDPNGIGPEIIFKSLQRKDIQSMATYVVFVPGNLWSFYRKRFDSKLASNQIENLKDIQSNKLNVFNFKTDQFNVEFGESSREGGNLAFESLTLATNAVKDGFCDLLVTAPINKANIQSKNFNFPGHTEFLENAWGGENLMFMVHENIKVGLVTQHIPLKDVSATLTGKAISKKLDAIYTSLKLDFGIRDPKIAVMGLNPHAGDNGLLGKEELDVIIPTLKNKLEKGMKVFGPYASDSFFTFDKLSMFDAVLAMYHDQGLIPFKTLAGMEGVNFTAGLPFVRTSPDHGVAYDIAKEHKADETSMVEALYAAVDIFSMRKMNTELEDNALKISSNQRRR
ncbi:4-hydroxythreonine-4-phosphate dehydrogenase PdxA [Weeksellaceae bacterium KMM 9713]|uniref:4-hydroxythreonine-4-phosphate dehydrogenase PdxA n=1 Tax=Profundicola chukchiensis TaxID=2961959 RepID=A0A9X4MTZ9_9FLAO|nr:4-hydroxythreonine-4-phosphate dehydrogenase PdxA [Profundicola chukchiensis]MDG4944886.1 4-hydroxythreonine-4-phosphate dehydrogenase PdxA [Profundicola chukchiensis]